MQNRYYSSTVFAVGIIISLIMLMLPVSAKTEDYPSAADMTAETAVLMDISTGQVLFDKSMDKRVYPASTTKIMTALLTVETCSPGESVTVNESAIDIDEWNSSNIALSPGETLTVDSLLYALMLPSANDAANVLAEHVAGSQEKFAEMMTQRAHEIGAVNTQYANAHGLHEPDHYTTAYDMALITQYAAKNETFMRYFGTSNKTIPATNLQPQERPFTNYQYMLVKESRYYDPRVIGGKVGYTTESKHTMSTIATKNGRTLVCVVMGSPNRWDKFTDTSTLLDYGFDKFRSFSLSPDNFKFSPIPMDNGEVLFETENTFTALIRDDIDESEVTINLDFPERYSKGDALPSNVEVTVPSRESTLPVTIGLQPLTSHINLDNVPLQESKKPGLFSYGRNSDSEKSPLFLPVIVGVLVCVLTASVSLIILRHVSLQRKRRQRIQRFNQRMQKHYGTGKKSA